MCVVSSARYRTGSYLAETKVTWAWGCHDLFQIAHYICSFRVGWMVLFGLYYCFLDDWDFPPDVPQLDCVWQFRHCLGKIENWQRSAWAKESELMLHGVFTDTTLLNCSERQDNTFFFLALLPWSITHMLRWDCQSPDSWHDDTRTRISRAYFSSELLKGLEDVNDSVCQAPPYLSQHQLSPARKLSTIVCSSTGFSTCSVWSSTLWLCPGRASSWRGIVWKQISSVFIADEYSADNKPVLVPERYFGKRILWNDLV